MDMDPTLCSEEQSAEVFCKQLELRYLLIMTHCFSVIECEWNSADFAIHRLGGVTALVAPDCKSLKNVGNF